MAATGAAVVATDRIGFADRVRIRATPETERLGLARAEGRVHGETTPSITSVPVIGVADEDVAIAVHIEGRADDVWVAPALLEFIDHGEGATVTVDGVNVRAIRNADGSWREEPFDNPRKLPKPWWRFW